MPVVHHQHPFVKDQRPEADTASLKFAQQLAIQQNNENTKEAFFVANLTIVESLIQRWYANFPTVQPYYAVDCNSDPIFLAALAKNSNVGFQCITKANIKSVINQSNRILFSSPSWTRGTLNFAVENNINFLSFDNERDLRRIYEQNPHANLLLNVTVNTNSCDPASELGCSIVESPELLQTAADLGLHCVGIGFHIGKGDMKADVFDKAIHYASQLFQYGRQIGHNMQVLNLGGGFESDVTFECLARSINQSLINYFDDSKVEIIATPGRFFASSVFSLVTNITEKVAVDVSHLTNDDFDAGKEGFVYHTNKGYYGPFGCINKNTAPQCNPLFDNGNLLDEEDQFLTSVRGPTSDEFDIIQTECKLQQLYVGDWLIWLDMGAYSLQNNASLADDFEEQLPIYYVNSNSIWDDDVCIDSEGASDSDSVISDDSVLNLCDLLEEDHSVWSTWMAAFGSRERASHSFNF